MSKLTIAINPKKHGLVSANQVGNTLSDDLLPISLRTYDDEPHENHESLKVTTKDGGCKGDGGDDDETAEAVGVCVIDESF